MDRKSSFEVYTVLNCDTIYLTDGLQETADSNTQIHPNTTQSIGWVLWMADKVDSCGYSM